MITNRLSTWCLVLGLGVVACGNAKESKKDKSAAEDGDEDTSKKKHGRGAGSAAASASAAASSQSPTASASASASASSGAADMVEVKGASLPILLLNDIPSKADVATFFLDRTEVSVADYRKCVSAGGCKAPEDIALNKGGCNYQATDREDHPMNCVYHDEAAAYCKSVGKRLPTLEEWELAAAGPENRVFPWGNDMPDKSTACYSQTSGTCKIGSHPKSNTPSGLEDMAGNVYEIMSVLGCLGTPPAGTPCLQPFQILMGGTWNKFESESIHSKKVGQSVGTPPETIGFRCAK